MSRRPAGALLVAVLLTSALSGCASSSAHLRGVCSGVVTGTKAIPAYRPIRPVTALQRGLARFTLLERAVSTVGEQALPGPDAAALQNRWLAPARTSLAAWSSQLETLRLAAEGGTEPQVRAALTSALAVGTVGVDTALLRTAGLSSCAVAFTPPSE